MAANCYYVAPSLAEKAATNSAGARPTANPWDRLTSDYSSSNAHSDPPAAPGAAAGNITQSPTGSAVRAPSATTVNAVGKHVFPGIGDSSLWKPAEDLANEGRRADMIGDSDTAISRFSKAVIIYQYDPQLYYELGMLYFKRQTLDSKAKEEDYDAAEVCFRSSLRLDRDLWYVWKGLGRISFERKNFAQSIYELQHSIECNPPASEISGEIKHYMEAAKKEIEKARKET
jgi:tetratricopeptide (TPR) repeat protein